MIYVRDYPLVSDQIEYPELAVIVRELQRVLDNHVPGHVVELGCYVGTTSLFLQRVLSAQVSDRTLHVYDSFAGLPQKQAPDHSPVGEQFTAGQLNAKKSTLITHFKHAGLPLPTIHKGWFEELSPADIPQPIAFAFLDGDFFRSIQTSLALITPKLTAGATIVIDDYQSESLPGTKHAVDDWAQAKGLPVRVEQSLAIVQNYS